MLACVQSGRAGLRRNYVCYGNWNTLLAQGNSNICTCTCIIHLPADLARRRLRRRPLRALAPRRRARGGRRPLRHAPGGHRHRPRPACDGTDASLVIAALVRGSKYAAHLQLVMLQGIALVGFNVVDVHGLPEATSLPCWWSPGGSRARGGARKWRLVERAGPMEPLAGVYVQRAGISAAEAADVIRRTAVHGRIPEPLRTAHLVAGGVGAGQSRGRT